MGRDLKELAKLKVVNLLLGFVLVLALLAGCSGGGAISSANKKTDSTSSSSGGSGNVIKVGILHSASGTMAMSETPVRDAELLAIKQINNNGGVLGKKIQPVIEDGASDNATFAEKATKLLEQDKVATVFGCWTSASRKAVKPIFEKDNGLLWYPVQYEGMESSPNIFYTGAAPNQQIVPAVEYMTKKFGKKVFLVGSDYVFPRTANSIIKKQAKALGMKVVGEEYTPLGDTDFATIVNKIKSSKPDYVFNTLNGDSNVAFFKQYRTAGISAKDIPTISVSIAEQEVKGIGASYLEGHYVSWNYYETTDTSANKKFVSAYKKAYGNKRVTDDPIEAGYNAVYLWAKAVKKAESTNVDKVKTAAKGITFDAPEGTVKIDGDNQHLYKQVRVGEIESNGMIKEVWGTKEAIKPDPYLKNYKWAKGLTGVQ
ncbi:urea ABC transporter substrate-binding protein [Sporolactobacillus sp. THM7-4]|nr:urea ABC transporter substrate-binding protein [Sporolactobacillus sp. THM7-4]